MPDPARSTVLFWPHHGRDQLKPTEGAKLFQSSLLVFLPAFAEFLPTNSTVVSFPFARPGCHNASKSLPEIPNKPAFPPTGAAARPLASYGGAYASQCTPTFNVRFGRIFQSSLMNQPYSS